MMKLKFFIGMCFAIVGLGLQAIPMALTYAPTGLAEQVRGFIARNAVHEFQRLFEFYPWLTAHTIIDKERNTLLHQLARADQSEMIAITHYFGNGDYTHSIANNVGEKPVDVAEDGTAAHSLLTAMGDVTGDVPPITEATQRGDKRTVEVLAKALTWKIAADRHAYEAEGRNKNPEGRRSFMGILESSMLAAVESQENEIFAFLFTLTLTDMLDPVTVHGNMYVRNRIWSNVLRNDNATAANTMIIDGSGSTGNAVYTAATAGAPNTLEVAIAAGGLEKLDDKKREKIVAQVYSAIKEQGKRNKPVEGYFEVLGILADHGILDHKTLLDSASKLGITLKTIVQRGENLQAQTAH